MMQLFKAPELMAVVVGNEDYDWQALEEYAEYKNGYSSGDQTVIANYLFLSICTGESAKIPSSYLLLVRSNINSFFVLFQDTLVLGSLP